MIMKFKLFMGMKDLQLNLVVWLITTLRIFVVNILTGDTRKEWCIKSIIATLFGVLSSDCSCFWNQKHCHDQCLHKQHDVNRMSLNSYWIVECYHYQIYIPWISCQNSMNFQMQPMKFVSWDFQSGYYHTYQQWWVDVLQYDCFCNYI